VKKVGIDIEVFSFKCEEGMSYSNEEESKKNRIFQREKRQELQLIIERCNKIPFEYVKVPSERHDKHVVFGSSKSRTIHFFPDDKCVNSFMRRCFFEHFSEPSHILKQARKQNVEASEEVEQKLTYPFSSKVARFQENLPIDSSQIFRRKKKVQEVVQTVRASSSAFGLSLSGTRQLMITRDVKKKDTVPLGSYTEPKAKRFSKIPAAYDIVCSAKKIDAKCDMCENEINNVYWKNARIHSVLCRGCYNARVLNIKNKSRGVIERFRNLKVMDSQYKKKRNCSFFHEHNGTKAHVYILSPKEFKKRCQRENLLNTVLKY
jgi:hypothetical protein